MELRAVLGGYGHVAGFRAVGLPGFSVQYLEAPEPDAFARMLAREPQFDVCEVPLGPYLVARSLGKPVTALPVVVTRDFQHTLLACRGGSGIRGPADLAGRRVGCRFYCQTSAIWARGILASEYGVDLNSVTWVVAEDEPVEGPLPGYPANVQRGSGASLGEMLATGEVDAVVGASPAGLPEAEPLIPEARLAEADWYRRIGVYPVNHTLVLSDALLQKEPSLAQGLFDALGAAKAAYLERLRSEGPSTAEDRLRVRQQAIVGGDPLPYGLEANRGALETLIGWAREQGVIAGPPAVEGLFVSVVVPGG